MEPPRDSTDEQLSAEQVERATRDVWARTLSEIPTTFGKIAYLASLRNLNSGAYEHFGLAHVYSEKLANRVLSNSHRQVFAEWLNFSLEQQRLDLEEYLHSVEDDRGKLLDTWLTLTPYRNLLPAEAREAEKLLYISDLEFILDLLRNELSS